MASQIKVEVVAEAEKAISVLRNFIKETNSLGKEIRSLQDGMSDSKKMEVLNNVADKGSAAMREFALSAQAASMPVEQLKAKLLELNKAAADGARAGIGKMREEISTFQDSVKKLKASATELAVTFAAVGGTAALVGKPAVEFEAAMRNVNVIAGKSEADFAKLTESVRLAGREFGISAAPVEKAEGMYQIMSSGITDTASAQGVLAQAMMAGKAGLTDTATAATVLLGVMNSYGQENMSAARASDVLFQTVNLGVTTFPELAQSLGQVTPLATAAGMSFEELGAVMAQLTVKGIKTPEATTAIRSALVNLIKPSEDARKVMAEYGFTVDAQTLKSDGFIKSLQKIWTATGGNTEAISRVIGDVQGLTGAMALMSDGGDGATRMLDQMQRAAGSTKKAFDEQQKSFSETWKAFTGEAVTAATSLAGAMLPPLTEALKLAKGVISVFNDMPPSIKNTVGAVGGLALSVGVMAQAWKTATLALGAFQALAALGGGGGLGGLKAGTMGVAQGAVSLADKLKLLATGGTALTGSVQGMNLAYTASVGAIGGVTAAGAALIAPLALVGGGIAYATYQQEKQNETNNAAIQKWEDVNAALRKHKDIRDALAQGKPIDASPKEIAQTANEMRAKRDVLQEEIAAKQQELLTATLAARKAGVDPKNDPAVQALETEIKTKQRLLEVYVKQIGQAQQASANARDAEPAKNAAKAAAEQDANARTKILEDYKRKAQANTYETKAAELAALDAVLAAFTRNGQIIKGVNQAQHEDILRLKETRVKLARDVAAEETKTAQAALQERVTLEEQAIKLELTQGKITLQQASERYKALSQMAGLSAIERGKHEQTAAEKANEATDAEIASVKRRVDANKMSLAQYITYLQQMLQGHTLNAQQRAKLEEDLTKALSDEVKKRQEAEANALAEKKARGEASLKEERDMLLRQSQDPNLDENSKSQKRVEAARIDKQLADEQASQQKELADLEKDRLGRVADAEQKRIDNGEDRYVALGAAKSAQYDIERRMIQAAGEAEIRKAEDKGAAQRILQGKLEALADKERSDLADITAKRNKSLDEAKKKIDDAANAQARMYGFKRGGQTMEEAFGKGNMGFSLDMGSGAATGTASSGGGTAPAGGAFNLSPTFGGGGIATANASPAAGGATPGSGGFLSPTEQQGATSSLPRSGSFLRTTDIPPRGSGWVPDGVLPEVAARERAAAAANGGGGAGASGGSITTNGIVINCTGSITINSSGGSGGKLASENESRNGFMSASRQTSAAGW